MNDRNKYILSVGTHYISNSGSDENGRYSGGKAGDQTGREWQLKAWYNRPWSVILRYPDQTVALKIAELGIDAALNDRIGYDQSERNTYWTHLQKAGYEPSKIAAACEADCSAGVCANVRAAGYLIGIKTLQGIPLCSSRNMRTEFVGAGFIALTASKYLVSPNYLLPGDILLYENHHAATNITVGSAVRGQWAPESHPTSGEEEPDDIQPPCVNIIGANVYVRKGPSKEYGSLGVVRQGDRLRYFGFDLPGNGWHLVEFLGQTGWVSGKYSLVEN